MIRILGEKVFIEQIEEETEGTLALPEKRNMTHALGKVVLVGDGRCKVGFEMKQFQMFVKPGDIVLYQANSLQQQNATYVRDGKELIILPQGDLIMKLKEPKITMDNIEMLGPWCLVNKGYNESDEKVIAIPETAEQFRQETQRFYLVKQGETAKLDADPGDELLVERMMVNPIKINDGEYGYIIAERVYGICKQEEELVEA